MAKREIRFGIIGAGLMGREFASAAARWSHLLNLEFVPRIVAVCDTVPAALSWFTDNFSGVSQAVTNYQELLANPGVEAVYCAVPHNLHAEVYCDVICAGKHLMGEKPFGIDLAANTAILNALAEHPNVLARCSSEIPFYPGAQQIIRFLKEGRFGTIIELENGFWHSSDLDRQKPINWKRIAKYNGEYGCLGDLGMHVLHVPLRFGYAPRNVRAILSKIVRERPDKDGRLVPCDTWDNGILACEVVADGQGFPMLLSTKRISPGDTNTWFIRILGTEFSAEFSTKYPKTLRTMTYRQGSAQSWEARDLGYEAAYPTITGGIFEFGFSDAILQMWAAFCDELVNGKAGMRQSFGCATPEETAQHHRVLTAALESQRTGRVIQL